ncbi:MAG: hypothetical protein BroJett025_02410 [Patescibacteria group bacterium]|nr:MAG: hypothetical protein BroJett025_02410 [Patescibacteria group bacterium]
MTQTFVYLPSDFALASTFEVGTYAKELALLIEGGVLLPKAIVVPKNTLKIIAQANNLQAKIFKLVQETNYLSSLSREETKKKIQHLITRQSIPHELAAHLLKTYHEYFDTSFVLIKNSERLPIPDIELQNIHSDTNFVDAILEVWASLASAKFEKLLLGTNSVHDILFPCPIMVQEQLESKISGIGLSFDQNDGNKSRITILSSWGIYSPLQQDFDRYSVDVRTGIVTTKQVTTKQVQFRRVLGKLREDAVLVKYQNQETLTPKLVKDIATIITKIKRNYLYQIQVIWAIQNEKLYILSVGEAEVQLKQHQNKTKTIQKIFVTATTNLTKLSENVDGIAVLNSGKLLFASAIHPSEIVKTKQRKYLVEAMSRTLSKSVDQSNKPLLYRANTYSSDEFRKLQFSSVYETKENNPLLGFRGGLRLVSQQETFKLELESLGKVLEKTRQAVTLVLPFVRSPEELTLLVQIVRNQGLLEHPRFSVWMELATPENIFNISEYPLNLIQGVLFNMQSLHSLAVGVDYSNPDIASHYSNHPILLRKFVEHGIGSILEKLGTQQLLSRCDIFVDLSNFNKELLEQLTDLHITGFVVNEEVTSTIKTCIMDTQQKRLL